MLSDGLLGHRLDHEFSPLEYRWRESERARAGSATLRERRPESANREASVEVDGGNKENGRSPSLAFAVERRTSAVAVLGRLGPAPAAARKARQRRCSRILRRATQRARPS